MKCGKLRKRKCLLPRLLHLCNDWFNYFFALSVMEPICTKMLKILVAEKANTLMRHYEFGLAVGLRDFVWEQS